MMKHKMIKHKMMRHNLFIVLFLAMIILGCAQNSIIEPMINNSNEINLTKKEVFCFPEMREVDACVEIYSPVCAKIDTGIRCITTPCPSFEYKTMSNSCFACSDEKVISYRKGECYIQ